MAELTFWISVAVLAVILTLPVLREEVRNQIDPASPAKVVMKVCHANADVGAGEFVSCMQRAASGLPGSGG